MRVRQKFVFYLFFFLLRVKVCIMFYFFFLFFNTYSILTGVFFFLIFSLEAMFLFFLSVECIIRRNLLNPKGTLKQKAFTKSFISQYGLFVRFSSKVFKYVSQTIKTYVSSTSKEFQQQFCF